MKYYPIQLDLSKKPVLVVGGGVVATRRILGLMEAGARVTVVSPEASDEVRGLASEKKLVWINQRMREVDLGGVLLVFVATDDRSQNKYIAEMCRRRRIFCNVADDAELCDFVIPSRVTRGDFMVTVSTSGKVPFLSKQVRIELERLYGSEMGELLSLLSRKRRELLDTGKSNLIEKLSRLDVMPLRELLRRGSRMEAEQWLKEKFDS